MKKLPKTGHGFGPQTVAEKVFWCVTVVPVIFVCETAEKIACLFRRKK